MKNRTLGVFIFLMIVVFLMAFTNPKSSAVKIPFQTSQTSINRGKAVYAQYCMQCHQIDGSGVSRMNPPLIKTFYVLGNKETLISIIVKGFNKEIEIDGDTYSNPMPAHLFLTDQQVADVATYVRNSFGNKATAITLTEVKAIKSKIK